MSNIKICPENFLTSMTLTALPEAAETGAIDNVISPYRGQQFQAQAPGTQEIYGSSSTAFWADGFAIHDHNFGAGSTFRLYLYAEANQAGEVVYDSGEVSGIDLIPLGLWRAGIDPYGGQYDNTSTEFSVLWFDLANFTSFKLVITSSNTITIGNLFLGKSIPLTYNFSWGNSLTWNTGVELLRTAGGSLVAESTRQAPYRVLSITLSAVLSTEREELTKALVDFATLPMLISAYPKNEDFVLESAHSFLGIPSPASKWSHSRRSRHSTQLTFNEI